MEWLVQKGEFLALGPVKLAAIHNQAGDAVAMAAKEFRAAFHHNIRAMFDRTTKRWRSHGVIYDQGNTGRMGDFQQY